MHTIQELQNLLYKDIQAISYPSAPKDLYAPIHYIINLGGKRIRPVLVLMGTELFAQPALKAMPAALAIEVFHNFTLVHDDIMDQAPLRRGQPTVHEKWDVNTAILSGDIMMVEANKHLSKVEERYLKRVLDTFNATAQGVCEGQQFDMEFERRNDVTLEEYINMIRLKTAVLLGGALKLGAILGDASTEDAELLYNFGEHLGVAYQIQDDILDVYGDPLHFGKQVGGDILCNKKTYLLLSALNDTAIATDLNKWLSVNEVERNEEKVAAVTALYEQAQVRELAEAKVQTYADKAFKALDAINQPESAKAQLRLLAEEVLQRKY